MTPEQARALMHEWTASASLRTHMEAVAACMGAYAADIAPADADRWRIAGLLHDFDYERFPNNDRRADAEHPAEGVRHLASIGVDREILDAILGHASYTGVARATPMARVLFAVDDLAGFIVACAKVRPDGLASLEPKSVRKKLKDRSFAAAVSREDIAAGSADVAALLGKDPAAFEHEHPARCIRAIREAGLA